MATERGSFLIEVGHLIDPGRVQTAGSDFYRKPYAGTSAEPKITDAEKDKEIRHPHKSEDDLIDDLINSIL
jgi:hypothetical protein